MPVSVNPVQSQPSDTDQILRALQTVGSLFKDFSSFRSTKKEEIEKLKREQEKQAIDFKSKWIETPDSNAEIKNANVPSFLQGQTSPGMGYSMRKTQTAGLMTPYQAHMLSYREEEQNVRREKERFERENLNDKQLETVNDYNDAVAALSDMERLAKSRYTGPIDGYMPDVLTGKEEAQFRSKVGKFQDKYRKLITGAAAGDKELSRIEKRNPSLYDKFENFMAKLEESKKEVLASRSRYLNNLASVGKKVDKYLSGDQQDSNQNTGGASGGWGSALAGSDKKGLRPGSIIDVKGKRYQVGPDGDQLIEVK